MSHRIRAVARAPFRRPAVVAIAAALWTMHFAPSAPRLQRIEMVSLDGQVQNSFALPVSDRRLAVIEEGMRLARVPDYRRRSDAYYQTRWALQLAQFYAADSRELETLPSKPAGPGQKSAVSQASFEDSDGQQSHAAADGLAWQEYWNRRCEVARERLRQLEPGPRVATIFSRLRLGPVTAGRLPVSTLVLAGIAAGGAFLVSRILLGGARPRAIGLRTMYPLEVPRDWFHERVTWSRLRAALTIAAGVELGAVVAVLAALLIA